MVIYKSAARPINLSHMHDTLIKIKEMLLSHFIEHVQVLNVHQQSKLLNNSTQISTSR